MAKKFVTRTIKTTTVTAAVCYRNSLEVSKSNFVLPGTYKSDEQIKKAILENFGENDFVIVNIDSTVENESPYRCTEEEFLSVAKPFSRNAKSSDFETNE